MDHDYTVKDLLHREPTKELYSFYIPDARSFFYFRKSVRARLSGCAPAWAARLGDT